MKILLIYPTDLISPDLLPHVGYAIYFRVNYPPTNLGYLASYLENAGHKVKILDCAVEKYNLDDIKQEIKHFNPDVVGITSNTQLIYGAMAIAKITKEINPNCLTIVGGSHVTYMAVESLTECPYIDVAVRGEGEETIYELLEKKREKWKDVRGITFRYNGKIIHNPDRGFIENLDEIPFPAYHLMPMKKYVAYGQLVDSWAHGQPFGGVLTSRGCPYNCAFCASKTLGKKWRIRSPENIIDEVRLLVDKYKRREIEFLDDSFTINEKRTEEICKLIKKEGLDISWFCSTRVDRFTKSMAHIMHNSGCHSVFFGIESGDQEILNFLNKGFDLERAEQSVKIAKKAGLNVITFFIIGTPLDTKDKIWKTINFAKKLKPTFALFNQLTPYPGTKIYEIAEKKNLFITKDWSKYITMSSPVIRIPGVTHEELKMFLKKANFSFYFTPSYFFTTLREIIVSKNTSKIIVDHIKMLVTSQY